MISAQKSQKNVLKDLTSGNHSLGTKEVAHKKYAQPLLSVLLGFFEELLHKFDVLIGHICYGVGVGTVEVDKPKFWDYLCGLGLDGL